MTLPTLGWLCGVLGSSNSFGNHELKICFDSRKLTPGDTFWALRGARDGHEFVETVLKSGAAAAVVNRSFQISDAAFRTKLISVDDTMFALSAAASAWRNSVKARVIGLTGSVGKTTTKDYVRAAFNRTCLVNATEGNFNNELGVPLTILRTPLETEVLICEMGAARKGDINHLCKIADPQWGLVTAITEAHIESFGSIDGVMQTKGELFDYVAGRGIAFVPIEDKRCIKASSSCKTRVGYGFQKPTADWESVYVHGERLGFDEEARARFEVHGAKIELSVPGRPAAQAALAAMTIALQHGILPQQAAQAVSLAQPTKGRATVRKVGTVTLIDDSYNASPASMRSALETLSLRQGPRKIAILGDMLELGEVTDSAHRDIVGELDRAGVSLAVLIGPNFSHVASAASTQAQLRTYSSVEQALPTLQQLIHANDLVLVKASRGMALDRIVIKIEELFH